MVTVTDDDGDSDTDMYEYIIIYDPDGGFVTGGGWIDSPPGAYAADQTLTGKANFGFVSKYKKGTSTPTGETEFQFKAGDLNFHSDSYDWLVVAGPKAQYKGVGTINGSGHYGFKLFAIDEALTPSTDVDLFRIKIWDKDDSDAIVYDNQMGEVEDADPTTAIGGGNIKIHQAAAKPAVGMLPDRYVLAGNVPNPFNPRTAIRFALPEAVRVTLQVYNLQGQQVATLIGGERYEAGRYTVEFDASELASGLYLYCLEAGAFRQVRKMLLLK